MRGTVRVTQRLNITAMRSNSELLTFVPVDDAGGKPVRLQRLRLRNNSSRRRKLTVTSYATLVLGSDPEETGMHVVTKWDLQSQSLFARNSYNPEFCDCITFATSAPTPASFTADRAWVHRA